MATISIEANVKQAQKALDLVRINQIPFATKNTLNALAETSKKRTEKEIRGKLDRPTRYAETMMFIKYALKTRLVAEYKVKDKGLVTKRGSRGQDIILGHLFDGGRRHGKGFEGLLARAGVMPRGMWAVPGEGATLDRYGNIDPKLIIKLVAYFSAFQGGEGNMTDKSRKAFNKREAKRVKGATTSEYTVIKVKKSGGLHPGIWQHVGFGSGRAIKPIIMFVSRQPTYKQYFDLDKTVRDVIREDFSYEFDRAMAFAITTAK